jgi:hypothetical protein
MALRAWLGYDGRDMAGRFGPRVLKAAGDDRDSKIKK